MNQGAAFSKLALSLLALTTVVAAASDASADRHRRPDRGRPTYPDRPRPGQPQPQPQPASEFKLQGRGGQGGELASHVTPTAIVYGVRVRAGDYVDNVSFAWYQPRREDNLYTVGDPQGVTKGFGGQGGDDSGWWTCPRGQGVIGVRGAAGDLVDRFGVICGDVTNPDPASPSNTYSPMWGGRGGNRFDGDFCPRGTVAVSFNVRSGAYVDNLQPVCLAAR